MMNIDDEKNKLEVMREKLANSNSPGFIGEFDPSEAEALGAFSEDAITEAEALETDMDMEDNHG